MGSRSRNRRHSRGREDRYRRSRSKEDKPSRTSRPAASPPKLNKKIEQKVEIVVIPVKVEQENVIDSTNDILETILMENKLRSQRSPSPDRLRLYKSPSPSPLKRKAKERSLSPGTKEIRAYWAEKEEKKKRKKSKKSKERRMSDDDLEKLVNQPPVP